MKADHADVAVAVKGPPPTLLPPIIGSRPTKNNADIGLPLQALQVGSGRYHTKSDDVTNEASRRAQPTAVHIAPPRYREKVGPRLKARKLLTSKNIRAS